MEKFKVELKRTALKQLRKFPQVIQTKILSGIEQFLQGRPHMADGKHIKKLVAGYRLRVGDYRIFYYIEKKSVIITSIVRRTSKTY